MDKFEMNKLIFRKLGLLMLLQFAIIGVWANNSDKTSTLQEQLKNTTDVDKKMELLYALSNDIAHSDLDLAIDYAEKGLGVSTENQSKKDIVRFNRLLGKLYLEKGKKDISLLKLETAVRIANEENLKRLEADCRINLGYYWYRLGDSTNTIDNYKKGYDLYHELGNNKGVAQSSLKLGWGYDMFGNYKEAEKYFQKAMEMEDMITDTALIINIYNGMAAFFINKSIKQHQAIQYLERALDLAKSMGDSYHMGRIHNALGFLYGSLDNRETAHSFYQKGLEIFEKLDNKAEICWLYIQIGELYSAEKRFDEALNYFEKALAIVNDIDNSVIQTAEIYLAIGQVHRQKEEDFNKALQFFEKALDLAKRNDLTFYITNAELSIGLCHIAMDNLEEGKKWCESVVDKTQNHLVLSQQTCDCLYQAAQGLGDYKTALQYHEQLKTLTDSLHNEELSEKINNLATKQAYEMELSEIQKEQAIQAANMQTKSIKTIGIISFLALLIIMLLLLSIIKKNAQKKQLQALSLVRKEMIANVSHDLRTPITIMSGYIETMLMRLGKTSLADQQKYLNIILDSADRLSQLIGQLFEYSKLEAQQIQPTKESFQLADLIKDTFSRYQIIAEKQNIQIQLNCKEDIPVVYADAILIERVIQNLIDNALKFTPENGVITICLSNNEDQVQVEIADTGKGISKEQEQLIFERYEKSKSSNGAGLGLTIVKNILEMHGSAIKVNSKINQGTKFIFSLPTTH